MRTGESDFFYHSKINCKNTVVSKVTHKPPHASCMLVVCLCFLSLRIKELSCCNFAAFFKLYINKSTNDSLYSVLQCFRDDALQHDVGPADIRHTEVDQNILGKMLSVQNIFLFKKRNPVLTRLSGVFNSFDMLCL